jgi:hypothetical protein
MALIPVWNCCYASSIYPLSRLRLGQQTATYGEKFICDRPRVRAPRPSRPRNHHRASPLRCSQTRRTVRRWQARREFARWFSVRKSSGGTARATPPELQTRPQACVSAAPRLLGCSECGNDQAMTATLACIWLMKGSQILKCTKQGFLFVCVFNATHIAPVLSFNHFGFRIVAPGQHFSIANLILWGWI